MRTYSSTWRAARTPRRSTKHSPWPTSRPPPTSSSRSTNRPNGLDGYVSLEVSPELARDCEGTVNEARRLHQAVGRKNLMIKVPATPECIPAIQQLISDGININVTLIFSLEGYAAVARAFIDGLAARAEKGLPLGRRLGGIVLRQPRRYAGRQTARRADRPGSRIRRRDSRPNLSALKSKAAIANAKLAYQIFKRIFSEPEWQALADHGARPQRVLWASTSTKNPALPATYYVDTLIGPHTVNTLPPATLKAFRDQGKVANTVETDPEGAQTVIDGLEQAGISMPQVWQKLQDDGVNLFADAFKSLLASIDAKRRAATARGEASQVDVALGYVDELVEAEG